MSMDQILEKLVTGVFTYEGYLNDGLFGDKINSVLVTESGEFHWWALLILIVLGLLLAGVMMDSDEDIEIRLRIVISVVLFAAVLAGVRGALCIGVIASFAIWGVILAGIRCWEYFK